MTGSRRALGLMLIICVGGAATACGATARTPTALSHPTRHHHHARASRAATTPSPSVASTPTPSSTPSTPPSISVSTSTSRSVPVQTPSAPPAPVITQEPPVGGVTNPNQVEATVNRVNLEGTVRVDGSPDRLYLLNVTLRNPTPAMILFALNDILVGPGSSNPQTSRNDYVLTGVTATNSLFPYPIVPTHAEAVVVRVPSNRAVTGNLTVEVPVAPSYSVWIAGDSAPVATFSA
ncbi:MAG: hypothetical protein OWU33_10205 [Firmicutes bacterium]|nr:hypothetical protein [Bacillota bacterium]